MQRLIDGVHRFRREEFGRYRDLFAQLANEGQKPHALFITCADSRVIAELITHSRPGELFVVKNVGNIVPPNGSSGERNSTAAAIEFAASVLQVSDIVVCGHTQCGAMHGIANGIDHLDLSAAPHLRTWLDVAAPVKQTLETHYSHVTDPEDRATAAAEENVLFGLENLHTYPIVADRLAKGVLRLHAWVFKIATAELYAFDPEAKQFSRLVES